MSMIADLNADTASADPNGLLDVGGTLYFGASDGLKGRELWRSDGTAAGTFLVADIAPGTQSSNALPLAALGDNRFLLTVNGTSLWVSDGTAAGTQKVGDVVPDSGFPTGVADGKLFFTAHFPTTGQELWVSDGTSAGTHLVKDINPGTSYTGIYGPFVAAGGIIYFSADDGVHGFELWRSDGTDAGTFMVKDVVPGASPSYVPGVGALGDTIYFTSPNSTSGFDLWKSDGTAAGTQLALPLSLTRPASLYTVGNSLFFLNGSTLYKTDGTSVSSVGGPTGASPMYDFNGVAYFHSGNALWTSDGTPAGTTVVQTSQSAIYTMAISPTAIYYVAADSGGANPRIWRSDGTTAGTFALDTPPVPTSYLELTVSAGTLYFAAGLPAMGSELMRVDPGATASSLVKEINVTTLSSDPIVYQTVGNYTYFLTRKDGQYANYLLWRTDGTAAGTVFLFDTGYQEPGLRTLSAVAFGDSAVMKIGPKIWITGPQPGSHRVLFAATSDYDLSPPVVVGGRIYFGVEEAAPPFRKQLWTSDGQTTSLFPMPDGAPDLFGLGFLFGAGGLLYFTEGGTADVAGLWRTDGTTAGTFRVGAHGPSPTMSDVGGTLFFFAQDDAGKLRLWKSDGTAAGTSVVAPNLTVNRNPDGPISAGFYHGSLYFAASLDGGTTGVEIWKSDGTAAGTVLLKDISPGKNGISPREFQTAADKLFFNAGAQLFVTDGTEAGTQLLAPEMTQNTMPEATWTTRGPQQLTAVGQYLYFVAGDNIRGIELCRSDGTFGGTVMVQDLNPGYPGALYHGGVYLKGVTTIAALGDTAIFGANDGVHGWEPWKAHYDGEPVADAGDGYQVLEGQSITLSGARSRPGARPIVSYEWDLDFNFAADGFHADATGVTALIGNLDGPYTYTVALRVTDDLGVSTIDTARINVINVAPRLAISGPSTPVAEGSPYTLNLAVLGDPGPDTVKSWQIYWGDGTSQTITGNPSSVDHVYANGPATYPVAASATDEDGTFTTRGLRVGVSDPAFGNAGIVVNPGSHADARVTVQADGRIVAVGGQSDFEIDRYLPDGKPDPSFGNSGHYTLDMTDGGVERASAVALLDDGRIVVGGTASSGAGYDWVVARLLADGTPDPSFGDGGKVRLNLGPLDGNELHDLILLPGGLILAAGNVNEGAAGGGINFAVLRLTADGTPDPSFGTGGIRTVDFGGGDDRAFGVGLQSTGRIILGGTANYGAGNAHFALARLTPSGQLDTGPAGTPFATGKVSPANARYLDSQAVSLAVQRDDRILLAGGGYDSNRRFEYTVIRYTGDGAFDSTFGNQGGSPKDGIWSVDPYNAGVINAITLTPVGKIVLIGPGLKLGGLTPTGGSDLTFGPRSIIAGISFVDLAPGDEFGGSLAVAPDGTVVLLAAGEMGAVLTRVGSEPSDLAVTVTNVAPTNADVGADRTVNEGTKVSMSATFVDPGVDPWVYGWHVTASNGQVVADGTAKAFDFTPTDNGVYTVEFTVTDDGGGSTSDTAVVTVGNLPPSVELGNPRTTNEGAPFSLTGTETDPGAADVLSRHWTIQYPSGEVVDGGTLPTLTFTPPDNGLYTVFVTVSDDDGASNSDSVAVTVTNVAPTLTPLAPAAVFVGDTFDLNLTASDPGRDTISKLLVNWGDTSTATLTSVGTTRHAYPSAGRYTISVTPTDEDGTYPAVTRTILVTPRPTLASGVLTINGTAFADTLLVTAGGGTLAVNINGLVTSYPADGVTQVNANLADGNDAVTFSGPVPGGTTDLGLANDTFTVDAVDTSVPITVLGNSGSDTLTVNPGAARPVSFDGGVGSDTLVLNGTDADDTFDLTTTSSTSTGGGLANPKAVSMTAVEYRSVVGGAGNDTFHLTDYGIALIVDTLAGGDGDDLFVIGDPTVDNVWDHNETLTGGAGNDTVVYNDQKSTRSLDYFVSDTWVSRSYWGYSTSGVESTTLNAGSGADRIDVTPSTTARFTINAGGPAFTAPADRLGLPTSTTGAILNLTDFDSGTYTFGDGRLPIRFTGVEQLSPKDTTRPTVTSANYHPGAKPSLEFQFSENVLGGVDLADLEVTNLATGQLLPASSFYLGISGGLAFNTSATWFSAGTLADGNYRGRIPAASLMDPSGNTMAADFTVDFFVLAGDATGDRAVDFNDLVRVAQNYNGNGKSWADGDFTGDGVVDFNDLVILAQRYNTSLPAPSAAAAAETATVLTDGTLMPSSAAVADQPGRPLEQNSGLTPNPAAKRPAGQIFAKPASKQVPKAEPKPLSRIQPVVRAQPPEPVTARSQSGYGVAPATFCSTSIKRRKPSSQLVTSDPTV
jgi:uncharacterized delta-60 repeat protein